MKCTWNIYIMHSWNSQQAFVLIVSDFSFLCCFTAWELSPDLCGCQNAALPWADRYAFGFEIISHPILVFLLLKLHQRLIWGANIYLNIPVRKSWKILMKGYCSIATLHILDSMIYILDSKIYFITLFLWLRDTHTSYKCCSDNFPL